MRIAIIRAIQLAATVVLWMILNSLTSAQDVPKAHVRFFNDSARAVNFYIDGQFRCAVRANPEGNEEYCDTFEATIGKHTVSIEGPRLPDQSCDLYVAQEGAEAHLSKGGRLHCFMPGRAHL
jgi:hypothetical protein